MPSSTVGTAGKPYAHTKAGQEALMLILSQEMKGTGVTTNVLLAKTFEMKREKISHPNPGNTTWTTPEELTGAFLYLLSDEAGAVYGAKISLFGTY
jgi:NAD(P)-dependent dehydrogenase (short-subunit alcohol dehydrogenase family)